MTRQQPRPIRGTIAMVCTVLSALALSSSPASAAYRAWFAPWDYVGDFDEGDVSEDFTMMVPPAGACGLRMNDPSYYRWTTTYDNTVSSADFTKDVIIWVDRPACSRPFSVRYADDSHTFTHADVISMELFTNYAVHWVNDSGNYLYTCNACTTAADFAVVPPDDDFSVLTATAFKAIGTTIVDPRRQFGVSAAIGGLAREVTQLQQLLQQRIADRRRGTLALVEASVRSLEDAATAALSSALAGTNRCDALVRQGAYSTAFVACTGAGHDVEHSQSLMRTAWFLYHPRAK